MTEPQFLQIDHKPISEAPALGIHPVDNQPFSADDQIKVEELQDQKVEEYENVPQNDNNNESDDDDLQVVQVVKLVKTTIPKTGAKITLEEINVSSQVIAAKSGDVRREWQLATVVTRNNFKSDGIPWYNAKFRVQFTDYTSRYCDPTELAYMKPKEAPYAIGMRVVAYYPLNPADFDSARILLSGLICERPRTINDNRYLILFDNGTAIYSKPEETFIIFQMPSDLQSKSLSHLNDYPSHKLYMKSYMEEYPDIPMVRLSAGDVVDLYHTDIDSSPMKRARIIKVDQKIALIRFIHDSKHEWVFRGSWRFLNLFQSPSVKIKWMKSHQATPSDAPLSDQTNIRTINHGTRRMMPRQHALQHSRSGLATRAVIEYEGPEENEEKIINPDLLNPEEPLPAGAMQDLAHFKAYDPLTSGKQNDKKNTARKGTTVPPTRLGATQSKEPINLQPRVDSIYVPKGTFIPHDTCSHTCLGGADETADWRDINPFMVPIRLGWERNLINQATRSLVTYRAPCFRRLRNMEELSYYLYLTKSLLDIDMFSFDVNLRLWPDEDNIAKPLAQYEPDLSKGSEPQPISVLNERTAEQMDKNFIYRADRYPHRKHLDTIMRATDQDFLACCSCTDNCADSSKCECQVLLTQQTGKTLGDPLWNQPSYAHKRLLDHRVAIFECNPKCPCNSRCGNRVVQNGIRARLQVFRTKKKGWGVRTLHDLPKGAFLCVYTAQMLDNEVAETEGAQFGDAYLADLDFIEIFEEMKSDYESDVENSDDEDESDNRERNKRSKDYSSDSSDFKVSPKADVSSDESEYDGNEARKLKQRKDVPAWGKPTPPYTQPADSDSDDSVVCLSEDTIKPLPKQSDRVCTISIPNGQGGTSQVNVRIPFETATTIMGQNQHQPAEVNDSDSNDLSESNARSLRNRKKGVSYKEPTLDDTFDNYPRARPLDPIVANGDSSERKRKLEKSSKTSSKDRKAMNGSSKAAPRTNNYIKIRKYYGESSTYVLDARQCGNIGRFMNHSCDPNSFVQNVFVDTHDLRFPWVSFFAKRDIKAYEELTWDYNYVVDSINNRKLWCYCEAANCRKRLL